MTTDDTLLTSDNHALLLIDHQYLQLLAVRSHANDTIVNNTVMLAKGAKIFGVPTLFTTAFAERQELAPLGVAAAGPQGRHPLTPQITAGSTQTDSGWPDGDADLPFCN